MRQVDLANIFLSLLNTNTRNPSSPPTSSVPLSGKGGLVTCVSQDSVPVQDSVTTGPVEDLFCLPPNREVVEEEKVGSASPRGSVVVAG